MKKDRVQTIQIASKFLLRVTFNTNPEYIAEEKNSLLSLNEDNFSP